MTCASWPHTPCVTPRRECQCRLWDVPSHHVRLLQPQKDRRWSVSYATPPASAVAPHCHGRKQMVTHPASPRLVTPHLPNPHLPTPYLLMPHLSTPQLPTPHPSPATPTCDTGRRCTVPAVGLSWRRCCTRCVTHTGCHSHLGGVEQDLLVERCSTCGQRCSTRTRRCACTWHLSCWRSRLASRWRPTAFTDMPCRGVVTMRLAWRALQWRSRRSPDQHGLLLLLVL